MSWVTISFGESVFSLFCIAAGGATCLGIEATISVEKIKVNLTENA